MDPIQVIIVADKNDRYCRSCQSGRTMKEITASLAKQLRRRFGDAVECQFVDINEVGEGAPVQLAPETLSDRTRLPIVLVNGAIRYKGLFSPTLIQRDLNLLLAQKPRTTEAHRKNNRLTDEQLRRLRLRQLILASVSEGSTHRLSHVPQGRNNQSILQKA